MRNLLRSFVFIGIVWGVIVPTVMAGTHPSYDINLDIDTVPFYNTESYDQAAPKPEDYLSEPIGMWPAWFRDVSTYLHALSDYSDRMILEPHGKTHEGREVFHLVISSPENMANLGSIIENMNRVASGTLSTAELNEITANMPAFVWLAYSIHGDEISGTDAATRLAYHLAAANDSLTLAMLDNLVILIDPSENPDGRERYLSMLQTYRSATPNYDARSMQHSGVWPWGRSNHYWFDLNRDWIVLTQPETIGRVRSILKYHPVVVVDGHEMGSNDNFLFSPPRQPINYNTPENVLKWYGVFGEEQARALDQRGWPYYTGEWNDQWYIGYASAWPTLFGTVGILYEQAGVDGRFVKQRSGYILTYHEAVNHQFTSSLANLETTLNNRGELLKDYHNARKGITQRGRESGLTYLFAPDPDQVKMNRFIMSLVDQGIEVQRATAEFQVGTATDIFGASHSSLSLPAGTFIVSTAQPQGALAKAIIEFDPHLKKDFLDDERRELEKHGDTKMYEISTWSIPMAYDLQAYTTTSRVNVNSEAVTELANPTGHLVEPDAQYGFVVDMEGELTYEMLNRLFQEKLTIYASEKPFTVEGRKFKPGALLLRRRGNTDDLSNILDRLASDVGINVYGVHTGWSSEGSQLGAPTFRLLVEPRIALGAGSPLSYTGSGSLWFAIDKQLGIPHSLLNVERIAYSDLSQYNVIILPGSWGGGLDRVLGRGGKRNLEDWVSDGGTLVLTGSSAAWAADTSNGMSSVRLRRQVLDKLGEYRLAVEREMAAESPEVDTVALWHPDRVPPEEEGASDEKKMNGKISEDEDQWMRRFYPRGVILQAVVDTEDWMAFGLGDRLPVTVYSDDAFLTKSPVKTVARFTPDENKLRMSGLLWPEARQRWAGTAFATRERRGNGQIIMFTNEPNMRAYWYGTRQMFLNAILFGPGATRGSEPYDNN